MAAKPAVDVFDVIRHFACMVGEHHAAERSALPERTVEDSYFECTEVKKVHSASAEGSLRDISVRDADVGRLS